MAEVSAFALSQLLSDLTGRRVSVSESNHAASECGRTYGIYDVVDLGYRIVLGADTPLLGSLGGVLMGMPDPLVKQGLAKQPMDEMLRDAMHEVLNVTSSVLSTEGRAVLRSMETDRFKGEQAARMLTTKAHLHSRFSVAMPGYTGGELSLITEM